MPRVGDGVTRVGWSDATAGTIVRVAESGKRIWFRYDKATLLNGPNSGADDALVFYPGGFCGHTSGKQRWHLEFNPDGLEQSATLRKDGHWRIVGTRDGVVHVGVRNHFFDFNF